MRRWSPSLVFALVVLSPLAAPGCGSDDTERVVVVDQTEPLGTLLVRWTIAGLADPNACAQSASAAIEISVLDPFGAEVAAFQQACAFFSTSITLRPGSYSALAFLVDVANQPRTTAAPIAPFAIRGNDVVDVPVDFPSDSFL